MITINRDALKAVSLFQAVRDIRYYLNGVLVQATATKTRLCATDGHTMAMHQADTENSESNPGMIIPSEAIKTALAVKKAERFDLAKVGDEWRMTANTGTVIIFTPIDGKFPDYSCVIPAQLSGELAQFYAEYILRCQRAAEVFSKRALVEIGHNGTGAGIVNCQEPNFLAIVMPFRHTGLTPESFAWAREALQFDEVAA